jgi:hypothetical protein
LFFACSPAKAQTAADSGVTRQSDAIVANYRKIIAFFPCWATNLPIPTW